MPQPTKFDLWVEYEKIAMHFNGLLMQLRLRALAGIGIIGTVSGILAADDSGFDWQTIALIASALLCVWIAIFVIDRCYYNRLLSGAVDAVLAIEYSTNGEVLEINMSTKIERAANMGDRVRTPKEAINWFYGIIALLLLLIILFSIYSLGLFIV